MVKDEDTLIRGYDQLDLQRAERLKKLYGAKYSRGVKPGTRR